ncbi:hypothetical protein NHX12_008016 [Muraenolepis orangiensis]|uniref:Uncharacterized protein n=1 Tax=Muraenolepis orangiensis TaxID=630683 RepID=A0A9Q0DJ03_9TELE|nr:hypothetical protein NHX12_008016 [Muraenolepis orangiensis]
MAVRSALQEAGCVKLGHLLKMTPSSVADAGELANTSRLLPRIRQLGFVLTHLNSEQWSEDYREYRFPSMTAAAAAVGEWQEEEWLTRKNQMQESKKLCRPSPGFERTGGG